jgi:N-methylhydantoinase B
MRLRDTDPILFRVLNNAFVSIADEMTALLHHVAFSLVVSEGRDASSSISLSNGDLVAHGSQDISAHLGTHSYSIKGMLAWFGSASPESFLSPGDIMIMNDAYIGGTHNQDVRVIMPIFFDNQVAAFITNSAHWPDIGGHVPGTFDPNARSSHGEGLIIPPCHLVKDGLTNDELIRLVLRNVRVSETAYGDLRAQIGAVRLAERRFQDLHALYGRDLLLAAMAETIEYSEALMKDTFANLPDGTWYTESLCDGDPAIPDSEPVPVRLKMTIRGDRAEYDFSESAPQAKGAINGPVACCVSAALAATKCVFAEVPMNEGISRAIEFVFAEKPSVVTAEYPAPISGMAATVYPHVANCVFKALIQICPDRAMAGPNGMSNMTWGGIDERPGFQDREYVCYLWLEGGWGGRPGRRDNHTSMTVFSTGTRNQPVELHERTAPVVFDCYRYEPDSAGPGFSRGGLGVTRRWYVSHGEATLSCLGDGGRFGPWGFGGGKSARPNRFVYAEGTDDERDIGMTVTGMEVKAERVLEYRQAGGGGFGDPLERDTSWVLEDVIDGYVTVDGAFTDYGVVISTESGEFAVDEQETRKRRRHLQGDSKQY